MSERHCDWRMSLQNCEDAQFFQIVLMIGAAFNAYITLSAFATCLIRRYMLGERWSEFLKGDSLSTALLILSGLFFVAQYLAVLLDAPAPVPGIIWSFIYPMKQVPMIGFLYTLSGFLPTTMKKDASKWYLGDRFRSNALLAFYCYYLTAGVVIISVAQFLRSTGNVTVGWKLERAGLLITAINNILLTIGFCFIAFSILKRLREVVAETKEMRAGESTPQDQLLDLAIQNINQATKLIISCDTIDILYFVVLATYPDFFTNIKLSKAMSILLNVIYPSTAVLFGTSLVIVDLKKYYLKSQLKEGSSRKDEMSVTPSPSNRPSIIGKDNVEQIIVELKPSDPDDL